MAKVIDFGKMTDAELDHFIAEQQGKRSTLTDVGNTLPSSLEKMSVGTLTAPGTLAELGMQGADYLRKLPVPGMPSQQAAAQAINQGPFGKSAQAMGLPPVGRPGDFYNSVQKQLEPITGKLYDPQTTTGKAVDSFVQALPAVVAPEGAGARALGSALGRRLVGSAAGAAGGAITADQLTKHGFSNLAPIGQAVGTAAGTFGLPTLLKRGVTPFPATDARLAMWNQLQQADPAIAQGAALKTGSPTAAKWQEAWTGHPPAVDPQAYAAYAQRQTGVPAGVAAQGGDIRSNVQTYRPNVQGTPTLQTPPGVQPYYTDSTGKRLSGEDVRQNWAADTLMHTRTGNSPPGQLDPARVARASNTYDPNPNSQLRLTSENAAQIGNFPHGGRPLSEVGNVLGAGAGLAARTFAPELSGYLGNEPEILGAIIGKGLGEMGNRGFGGTVGMSGPVQGYLGNQALRGYGQGVQMPGQPRPSILSTAAGGTARALSSAPLLDAATAAKLLALQGVKADMVSPPPDQQ